jgi:hypothetical protein
VRRTGASKVWHICLGEFIYVIDHCIMKKPSGRRCLLIRNSTPVPQRTRKSRWAMSFLMDAETNEIRLSNAKARLQEKKSKDKYKDRVKVPQQASIPSKFEESIAYGARP